MKNIGIDNKNNINNFTNYNFQDKNKNDNLIDAIKERINQKKYEIIGHGAFGYVYKIEYNNRIYAVKKISDPEDKETCEKEANNLSLLDKKRNKHIVRYYGHDYDEENNVFIIIMEYAGDSNLEKFIYEHKKYEIYIDEKIKIYIIKQICIGLRAIHNCGIIHRDLKPQNILIDEKYNIKIGDFGHSKISKNTYTYSQNKGTLQYSALELRNNQMHDNKVDMYALGCIIYELFTLNRYYDDKWDNNVQEIESNDPRWQDLINSLLSDDPDKRKNIDYVCKLFGWTE